MATPTSGSGGSAGLLTAYASTTTPAASAVLAAVSVPASGWYDVEVHAWNPGTTGIVLVDDANIGLYSDPVTSGTMVFQRLIPWNPFTIVAGNPPRFTRTRVYAQANIKVQAMALGTTGAIYVVALAAAPVTEWNAGV